MRNERSFFTFYTPSGQESAKKLYLRDMITIGEMQISGVLTMLMLSVMLMLCVPHRSIRRNSFARARWLMAVGTGLIAVQFLLQYIFGFRQMGITQAVFCNLLLFTPATLCCSMAILYMQNHGKVALRTWMTVCLLCAISTLLLIGTMLLDDVPIRQESPLLRMADYTGALIYVVMQSYIFSLQFKAYKQLELAVDEYFDRERHDLFGWMGWSMRTMAFLAFFVPLVIFMEGKTLVLFSVAYFFSIAYSTISLYTYGVSEDISRVEEAETSEKITAKNEKYDAAIEKPIEKWIKSDAYREHNLTLSVVARQMKVPRRQLQEWLRQSEYKNLAGLVTPLRIEEAKRILIERPEWSMETIADHCGFSSREYFHRAFRQIVGTTPAKFLQKNEEGY